MSKAKFIQENGETILPITHEEAVLDNDGKNLPSKYQQKQDENLLTESKTIVGAINELSTKGGGDNKVDSFFALSETLFTLDANDILNIKGIYRTTSETLNLPSVCYDDTSSTSAYGILITLTQTSGAPWGMQLYCPIDGAYIGATFSRTLWNFNDDGSLNARDWSLPKAQFIETSSGDILQDSLDNTWDWIQGDENWIQEVSDVAYANQDKIGETELVTNDKTLTGAINELFQSANNGKQLIADAIGNESVTVDSTFSAMSEAIIELKREGENEVENTRSTLASLMQEGGYNITGDEDINSLLELLELSGISVNEIMQIACGSYFTFILKNDGSLWSCGDNEYGQLGLGTSDTNLHATFTKVTTNINNDVKQISCASDYTFILKNDGSVWSCGRNDLGQLGLGDSTSRNTFTKVTTNINNVKRIVCGGYHTAILKTDGSVWSCGTNYYGQLGLGDSTSRDTFTQVTTNINNDVKQISCGQFHTVLLKNDGSVWSCGGNDYGHLGLGDTSNRYTFTKVTTNINNDVKQISCGNTYTFILKNDGSVWSCGRNSSGQLGLNNTTDQSTFTKVTTNINNDVKQISCGGAFTFIIKNDGSVWSCGQNNYYQLGLSDTSNRYTFTQVTTNINNVKRIVCGIRHTFTLKNDGSVWSCGNNEYGQLGLGDSTNKTTFTQVTSGI